jgi:hypothetical protein
MTEPRWKTSLTISIYPETRELINALFSDVGISLGIEELITQHASNFLTKTVTKLQDEIKKGEFSEADAQETQRLKALIDKLIVLQQKLRLDSSELEKIKKLRSWIFGKSQGVMP